MSSESPTRPDIQNGRRSNSLVGGFIKRTKSNDLLGERKFSGNFARNKLSESEQEDQSRGSRTPQPPPRLPSFSPQPELQTFGGDNYVPKMPPSATSSSAVPPSPAGVTGSGPAEFHARTTSMTDRGRYSYAHSTISSLNSPRRVRRRKDPTAYNILVVGARNSGKTSFLNFLKSSIAHPSTQDGVRNPELDSPPPSARTNGGTFVQHYQEIEMDNERVGLSLWDSQGFEKNLIDIQLREMSSFVESKFEDTFIEEMKVIRAPGYRDTHIHCVFFILDPSKLESNITQAAKQNTNGTTSSIYRSSRVVGAFEEDFELQILKTLQGKTTIVPVISKADTVTTTRMTYLKKMVWESLQMAGLDPMEALDFESSDSEDDIDEEDEDEEEETQVETPVDAKEEKKGSETLEGQNGDEKATAEAENGNAVPLRDNEASTKKPPTHKRATSNISVSAAMFKSGVMPLSVLSPDLHTLAGDGPVGRKFPWGFADPYNLEHCDFVRLKEACFNEWRGELREASREVFYERWRTVRLNRSSVHPVKKAPTPATRKSSGGIPIELGRSQVRY